MKYEMHLESSSNPGQIKARNEKNKEIGHINYSTSKTETSTPCHIYFLFVQEAYRNQGIGSELLKMALYDQFNSGCSHVNLHAYPESVNFFARKGAQLFYYDDHLSSMGFSQGSVLL